ncbi:hypothetical protein ACHAW5_004193 [Stephanodiscus triporus]|uniref:MYND-type domain-containing protein n=1 Tax=Stephanodiscus triporus TaxID=2934178 RepID=A0ABD3PTK4_9STRA
MASAVAITHCHRCGTESSSTRRIRACARCFSVGYCSKSCQRADWSGRGGHKSICRAGPVFCADPHDAAVRLEVKRSDLDEWEDVGPVSLVDDAANLTLDSAGSGGHHRTGTTPPRVYAARKLPKNAKRIMGKESSQNYIYQHSPDGVDENLLIFFHGAGDSHLPFDALGRRMALPQTATLSISASISLRSIGESNLGKSSTFVELPFGLGHTWFEEMDYECSGETLPTDHPRRSKSMNRALEMLYPLLCSLTDQGAPEPTWIPERVFLLGFSAGACLAMEMCRMWMDEGKMPLGGAICIAGGIQTKEAVSSVSGLTDSKQQKQPTDVLIIAGGDDSIYPTKAAKMSKQLYHQSKVQIHVQKGKGHSMLGSKDEMQVVMEFLSKRLVRRLVSMEGRSR